MTADLDQARENYRLLQHAYELCRGRQKLSRHDVHAIVDVGKRSEQLMRDIRAQVTDANGREAYFELVDKKDRVEEKHHHISSSGRTWREFTTGRFLQSDDSVRNKIGEMVDTIQASASLLGRVTDLELGETTIARSNAHRGTTDRSR